MQTQEQRRLQAKKLLLKQLENGIRSVSRNNPIERPYTEKEIEDKKHLISILDERLSGKKRKKVSKNSQGEVEDEWVIEIYSMKFGYFKNSERRKNKGKLTKKTKRIKQLSLVQTVKNRPGLIMNYKNGLMGISPKNHVFKMVKKEQSF